jgi:hypothetical protein
MAFSALDWFVGGDDPLTSTRGSFLSSLDNSFTENHDFFEPQEQSMPGSSVEVLFADYSRDFQ